MSARTQITTLIKNFLVSEVQGVQWVDLIQGALRQKGVSGSIACDNISYRHDSKDIRTATATYTIYLIDPECQDTVDDIADDIDSILDGNDFDGYLSQAEVTNIAYGAPRGLPSGGAAKITYIVSYQVE